MSQAGIFDNDVVLQSSRYESMPRDDRFDRSYLIKKMVGENRRVLELGCSTGFVSRILKESGCYVAGVELDRDAAEAAAKICDQVVVADLADPEWPGRVNDQFEVIVMGDVLEHLTAPHKVLQCVRQLLTPDGRIVVSLPNVVHWTQRLKVLFGSFQYQSVGLLDFTHLRFFDLRSARALIINSGYDIEAFHPIIGGRFSCHLRPLWQFSALRLPNLFAYQFLLKAKPREQQISGESLSRRGA